MSVVNSMLRDLGARKASVQLEAGIDGQAVGPSPLAEAYDRHEGFWRIVAGLMLAAVLGVGWFAYSLRPRPSLATDLAYRAAAEGRLREGKMGAPPAMVAAAPATVAAPPVEVGAAPVAAAAATPVARDESKEAGPDAGFLRLARSIETPVVERAPAQPANGAPGSGRPFPAAAIEAQWRNALASVGQGAPGEPQLHQLLGALLLRLSRHEEAASAYQAAVKAAPQSADAWIGLGMSLEMAGRPQDAVEAYRRALGSGSLDNEQQVFAQQRILVLR